MQDSKLIHLRETGARVSGQSVQGVLSSRRQPYFLGWPTDKSLGIKQGMNSQITKFSPKFATLSNKLTTC